MKKFLFIISLLLLSPASGSELRDYEKATLYRNSVAIENVRMHIATFDANTQMFGGSVFDYNWLNCTKAAELFGRQPRARTQFWCEKGGYKK
jgi:hypothetical protein